MKTKKRLQIAVIGSGAAGLSAAWLLSKAHNVTLLERDNRLGGHANTVEAHLAHQDGTPRNLPIDTGFIVYNEPGYPNFTRWMAQLGVQTQDSDMSFAVSRENGGFEYAGGPPLGLFAQPTNLFKPRFWLMLKDLARFYRTARPKIKESKDATLGEFLQSQGYSKAFLQDHLMPFAAAIWSTSAGNMARYPAQAFIDFCDNHGLLLWFNRPIWRTVSGGSRQYVNAVASAIGTDNVRTNFAVRTINRSDSDVTVLSENGESLTFDHVVIASHADQALQMLENPSENEQRFLGAFEYEPNEVVLHTDTRYLPKRKAAWCSWNYVELPNQSGAGDSSGTLACVSYWMNKLQTLRQPENYVVTLNPCFPIASDKIVSTQHYKHPLFTELTENAQQNLWQLQGKQRTWFCGSYFGAGFHEDAVKSGFDVAEQVGGVQRPWQLPDMPEAAENRLAS